MMEKLRVLVVKILTEKKRVSVACLFGFLVVGVLVSKIVSSKPEEKMTTYADLCKKCEAFIGGKDVISYASLKDDFYKNEKILNLLPLYRGVIGQKLLLEGKINESKTFIINENSQRKYPVLERYSEISFAIEDKNVEVGVCTEVEKQVQIEKILESAYRLKDDLEITVSDSAVTNSNVDKTIQVKKVSFKNLYFDNLIKIAFLEKRVSHADKELAVLEILESYYQQERESISAIVENFQNKSNLSLEDYISNRKATLKEKVSL